VNQTVISGLKAHIEPNTRAYTQKPAELKKLKKSDRQTAEKKTATLTRALITY